MLALAFQWNAWTKFTWGQLCEKLLSCNYFVNYFKTCFNWNLQVYHHGKQLQQFLWHCLSNSRTHLPVGRSPRKHHQKLLHRAGAQAKCHKLVLRNSVHDLHPFEYFYHPPKQKSEHRATWMLTVNGRFLCNWKHGGKCGKIRRMEHFICSIKAVISLFRWFWQGRTADRQLRQTYRLDSGWKWCGSTFFSCHFALWKTALFIAYSWLQVQVIWSGAHGRGWQSNFILLDEILIWEM